MLNLKLLDVFDLCDLDVESCQLEGRQVDKEQREWKTTHFRLGIIVPS